MTYSVHPTVAVGQLWSAAEQNTYVKDNLITLFPYTAAQQVVYSTSSATLAAATSAKMQVLRINSGATAAEFAGIIRARQGYGSTNWSFSTWNTAPLTTATDYTPANSIIQCGSFVDAGDETPRSPITFPIAFSKIPIVYHTWWLWSSSTYMYSGGVYEVTPTTVSLRVYAATPATKNWHTWIAIGEL